LKCDPAVEERRLVAVWEVGGEAFVLARLEAGEERGKE
jgi:hypothetical protein